MGGIPSPENPSPQLFSEEEEVSIDFGGRRRAAAAPAK